jgi:NADPH:quinone reductase-like Zn-dependent oxidoreductase
MAKSIKYLFLFKKFILFSITFLYIFYNHIINKMEAIEQYIRDKSFEGKNVIITGGTGGIGSNIAQAFLRCGANTMIVSKNEKKLLTLFGKKNI